MFRRIVDRRVFDNSVFILKCCFIFILQLIPFQLKAQYIALKSNLIYDAIAVPSLGAEVRIDSIYTVAVSGTYCPFSFASDRKWKNWSVRPEVRRWFRKSFNGPFVGTELFYGYFNASRVPFIGLKNRRGEGCFIGGGITAGWHKILSPHWGLEFSIAAGYVHVSYDKYLNYECGYNEGHNVRNLIMPTGISMSLVYVIR
ncbi:DUF3575 domain-containing protein [Segatella paludivivens]|uniref:DUF3575 domain-containing protein n=1 Tax=Segatella paludivivens TaxID=185294 RepID=UPI000367ADAD|nr:DUF3575 domain-containing protein [Segatella paludivivens]